MIDHQLQASSSKFFPTNNGGVKQIEREFAGTDKTDTQTRFF